MILSGLWRFLKLHYDTLLCTDLLPYGFGHINYRQNLNDSLYIFISRYSLNWIFIGLTIPSICYFIIIFWHFNFYKRIIFNFWKMVARNAYLVFFNIWYFKYESAIFFKYIIINIVRIYFSNLCLFINCFFRFLNFLFLEPQVVFLIE